MRKQVITHSICLFTLLMLFFSFSSTAQTADQKQIMDSLQQAGVKDTQYVKWLNWLAHSYWNTAPKQTDSLGRIALELARELQYDQGICQSYYEMAVGQWMLGNYPQGF